jgi:transposase-like protein
MKTMRLINELVKDENIIITNNDNIININNDNNINKNNLNNYLTNDDITNLSILNKIKLLNYNKQSNRSDNKNILNNYIYQNNIPVFLCNYCLKNFSRQYNLDRHKCKLKTNPIKNINYKYYI